MQITGYRLDSTEFHNAIERYYTEPPEEYEDYDPIRETEMQAERDEDLLWGV